MELPPAGWPGPAEPPALQRRRDPASARRVSPGPGRAGGGLGAQGPSALCSGRCVRAHPVRGTPCPDPPWGAGEGGAPETQSCAVTLPAPARSSRSRGPCPEPGMDGAARPLGSEQPRDPHSDFLGPESLTLLGNRVFVSAAPSPCGGLPHSRGSLEGCGFRPSHHTGPLGSSPSPSSGRGCSAPAPRLGRRPGRCALEQWGN